MIINEGKKKILEAYLNANDIFIGLWSFSNLQAQTNTFDITTIRTFELTTKLGYERKIIQKGTWSLVDSILNVYQTNNVVEFRSKEKWVGISGYFLITTPDNTGNLLSVIKFDSPSSIDVGSYNSLYIYPTIQLI